ncbi:MAG: DUF1223 domain-containing protein [Burkholderiales bacterium]|nr:DUF1223 domain-containing protein [Burkholderiales bacterium]
MSVLHVRALVSLAGALAAAAASAAPPDAARCAITPDAPRGWVVALFTSEGCDSCPPADRWLSATLPPAKRFETPGGAIGLAFHVDYWNGLGWPDRFSAPEFTQRQRDVAGRSGARTIYTPQVVEDGRERAPGTPRGGLTARAGAVPDARFTATQAWQADGALQVSGRAEVAAPFARHALVWVALVQHGLVSRVTRGENAGRTLDHDHVVRALAGPFRTASDGTAALDVRFAPPTEFVRERADVVMFAEDTRDGRTLQAVRAPVCASGG